MSNMTPREQIEKASIDWYYNEVKQDTDIDTAYQAGAEYGYNLAIENVVEWLCMNMTETNYWCINAQAFMSKPELINNLKQAMKL